MLRPLIICMHFCNLQIDFGLYVNGKSTSIPVPIIMIPSLFNGLSTMPFLLKENSKLCKPYKHKLVKYVN